MAIIGGAGNPVGGSFTGPAESLELVLDRAYAISGLIEATATMTDYIDFTTGNYTFDGIVQLIGYVNPADTGPGANAVFRITMNGVIIAYVKVETSNESMPTVEEVRLIIPPYTEIQVGAITDQIASTKLGSIIISGDVLRD